MRTTTVIAFVVALFGLACGPIAHAQVQKTVGEQTAAASTPLLDLSKERAMPRIRLVPLPNLTEAQVKERCLNSFGSAVTYAGLVGGEARNNPGQIFLYRLQVTLKSRGAMNYLLADGRPTCKVDFSRVMSGLGGEVFPDGTAIMEFDGVSLFWYNRNVQGAGFIIVPTSDSQQVAFTSFYGHDDGAKFADRRSSGTLTKH